MTEKDIGIVFKGRFCPLWGGMALFNSDKYWHGGMEDICPTLRAEKNDAGVVVEYEKED